MNGWFFKHPATRGIDIDDPKLTVVRHKILQQKKFLHKLYEDWYSLIEKYLGKRKSRVIELGSGSGFLETQIPQTIKTDVIHQPYIKLVMDGLEIPFQSDSLDAIVLLDVFHHLPDVEKFLVEAVRTLKTGGRVIMIEPWITAWSRIAYSWFHHEPVDMDMKKWQFDSFGPLSGSNQALPWIVFCRDKEKFQLNFQQISIIKIEPMMPFRYILGGGLSTWINPPDFCYTLIKRFESLFESQMDKWGMFALIVLEKVK